MGRDRRQQTQRAARLAVRKGRRKHACRAGLKHAALRCAMLCCAAQVNEYSLLLTWRGKSPELHPML